MLGKRPVFSDSARCLNLDGGFDLWECYIKKAEAYEDILKGRFLSVKYEDFLFEPIANIESVLRFAGVNYGRREVEALATQVNPERAMAFRQFPELLEFERSVRDRLAVFGY